MLCVWFGMLVDLTVAAGVLQLPGAACAAGNSPAVWTEIFTHNVPRMHEVQT
jgi:hypothetical protein